MAFWILVAGTTLGLAGWFYAALVRDSSSATPGSGDLAVYRDQLAEVESDVARGVLSQNAAERTRVEIGRRILAAVRVSETHQKAQQPALASILAGAFVAVALVGGVLFYGELGAPGYSDAPLSTRILQSGEIRAARPSQIEAETAQLPAEPVTDDSQLATMVAELRKVMRDRPGDVQGLTLLARNEALLGNLGAARAALEAVVVAKGASATIDDLGGLLDVMVMAAGGSVSQQADSVIAAILDNDPQNGPARYYLGLMHAQTGRPDLAFVFWRKLLEDGPEDALWIPPIRSSINALSQLAGVQYTPPAIRVERGPTQDDVDAAMDMTDLDRAAMIGDMVKRLSDRLATEGGPPEDWARLISALGVLGNTKQAQAIWTEAQTVFGNEPGALAIVRGGAASAGVDQ